MPGNSFCAIDIYGFTVDVIDVKQILNERKRFVIQ